MRESKGLSGCGKVAMIFITIIVVFVLVTYVLEIEDRSSRAFKSELSAATVHTYKTGQIIDGNIYDNVIPRSVAVKCSDGTFYEFGTFRQKDVIDAYRPFHTGTPVRVHVISYKGKFSTMQPQVYLVAP